MFQKCVRNVCLKFIFENNYEKKKCFNLNKWQFFKTTLCVLYVVKDKKKHGQPNLQYHKHHAMLTKKNMLHISRVHGVSCSLRQSFVFWVRSHNLQLFLDFLFFTTVVGIVVKIREKRFLKKTHACEIKTKNKWLCSAKMCVKGRS